MAHRSSMRIVPGGCVYRAGCETTTGHVAHALKLIVPVDGELGVAVDGVRYGLSSGRALLIPADLSQEVFTGVPRVTLMIDPESLGAPFRAFARGGASLILGAVAGEHLHRFAAEVLAAPLDDAAAVEAVFSTAHELLRAVGLERERALDPRVEAALELFRQPWLGLDHQAVARRSGIAPDHLSHLFSEQVGISAKRYALGVRTVAAIEQMSRGLSATQAAKRMRFSDLAHFSRATRQQFGHPPTRLPLARARVFAGVYGSDHMPAR